MSFNIFKHQVKYCMLNIEDQELNNLKDNREKRDIENSDLNNNLSLKHKNEEFFNIKESIEKNMITDDTQMQNKFKKSQIIEHTPTVEAKKSVSKDEQRKLEKIKRNEKKSGKDEGQYYLVDSKENNTHNKIKNKSKSPDVFKKNKKRSNKNKEEF